MTLDLRKRRFCFVIKGLATSVNIKECTFIKTKILSKLHSYCPSLGLLFWIVTKEKGGLIYLIMVNVPLNNDVILRFSILYNYYNYYNGNFY